MFLAIDGNSLINRAYYAIKPLRNKNGLCTNGITGFLNAYLKLKKLYNPAFAAVAFDVKGGSFRKSLYGGYKSSRKGMPDELAEQLPHLKKILLSLGVVTAEKKNYEADDLLGTISLIAEKNSVPCAIATGDRDFFQLINGLVTVYWLKTGGGEHCGVDFITGKYGVLPQQMLEVKALMGDASDNIPGVHGIGEKTAFELIQKYKTIRYIYENLETLDLSDNLKKKLRNGKEMCFLSRSLGEICRNAPVSDDIRDYRLRKPDCKELSEILTGLEMRGMLRKLGASPLLIQE